MTDTTEISPEQMVETLIQIQAELEQLRKRNAELEAMVAKLTPPKIIDRHGPYLLDDGVTGIAEEHTTCERGFRVWRMKISNGMTWWYRDDGVAYRQGVPIPSEEAPHVLQYIGPPF